MNAVAIAQNAPDRRRVGALPLIQKRGARMDISAEPSDAPLPTASRRQVYTPEPPNQGARTDGSDRLAPQQYV